MMKHLRNLSALGISMLVCSAALTAQGQAPLTPAGVVSATDAQYPIRSVADGAVVLDVALDAGGGVKGTTVVRDIASLTAIATSSVQSWKFNPASGKAASEASVVRVVFAFRPPEYRAAGPNFSPLLRGADSSAKNAPGYIPAGILSVAPYPEYPVNAAMAGAVVVQVTVDRSGEIGSVKIIRDLPPFTALAVSAAKNWRFQAARLNGQPVVSNVAIAFVFAPLPAGG
jgi:TonB family protein